MSLSKLTSLSLLALVAAQSRITPSGNYTPTYGECPTGHTFVRPASEGLNGREREWRTARNWQVKYALGDYLRNVGIDGFDVDEYIDALHEDPAKVPVIAVSFSGGGTRAQLCELGLYQGLDARHQASVDAKTGGLLQATTYISGLSGGALTLSGIGPVGFPSLAALIQNGNLNLTLSTDQIAEVAGKAELGFPITWADVSGISSIYNLGRPIGNDTNDPLSWTWSGIANNEAFKNGSIPMPILLDSEVVTEGEFSNTYAAPNFTVYVPDAEDYTFYELTPFEFGLWNGRVQAFADMQYLGSNLTNGQPAQDYCVKGYDVAAYLGGSSLSALNLWYIQQLSNGEAGQFAKRSIPYPENEDKLEQWRVDNGSMELVGISQEVAQEFNVSYSEILYALFPNPFVGYSNGVDQGTQETPYLQLVDGSEAGQNNPVWPLIQPARAVDFIIISDNAGTELSSGWMNGTSLVNSYNAATAAGLPFPKIPQVNTMINLNHTSRPVFYGCFEDNVPLVLYAADQPYTAYTNISFTSSSWTENQVRQLTDNGLYLISQDSDRLAEDWTTCLACAAISKSLGRLGIDTPDVCQKCWSRYCWDGTENDADPSFLAPYLVLNATLGFDDWNSTVFYT